MRVQPVLPCFGQLITQRLTPEKAQEFDRLDRGWLLPIKTLDKNGFDIVITPQRNNDKPDQLQAFVHVKQGYSIPTETDHFVRLENISVKRPASEIVGALIARANSKLFYQLSKAYQRVGYGAVVGQALRKRLIPPEQWIVHNPL